MCGREGGGCITRDEGDAHYRSGTRRSRVRKIQAGEKRGSVWALEASNFFQADVQTGLGLFLAAYLA